MRYTYTKPPPLLPLFRSEFQLRLLTELFVRHGEGRSVSELASSAKVPQATASRELARLERAGIVRSRRRGRMRIVEADEANPYFHELQALLMKTAGPASVLAQELQSVDGIEQALIFGSWAARYHGELGPPPHDIDLLILGHPRLDDLYEACRRAEATLRVDVNPIVRSSDDWAAPDESGFLEAVRLGPLVPVLPS